MRVNRESGYYTRYRLKKLSGYIKSCRGESRPRKVPPLILESRNAGEYRARASTSARCRTAVTHVLTDFTKAAILEIGLISQRIHKTDKIRFILITEWYSTVGQQGVEGGAGSYSAAVMINNSPK